MSESKQKYAGVTPTEAQIAAFTRAYFGADCDGQVGRCVSGLTAALNVDRKIAAAPELVEALQSIAQYGSDTLSGRTDGPDDRDWQREAVLEMTRRARAALVKAGA